MCSFLETIPYCGSLSILYMMDVLVWYLWVTVTRLRYMYVGIFDVDDVSISACTHFTLIIDMRWLLQHVWKQVSVFPDGELHVKAVKPRNKGKWSSLLSTSGTTRTPSVLSSKAPGSPHWDPRPHTPRTPLKPKQPESSPSYRYLYTWRGCYPTASFVAALLAVTSLAGQSCSWCGDFQRLPTGGSKPRPSS